VPSEYQQVLTALGKSGDFKANVLKVNIPRNDLQVTVANVKTRANTGVPMIPICPLMSRQPKFALCTFAGASAADSGWGYFGGTPGGTRYSSARQIEKANVDNLEIAALTLPAKQVKIPGILVDFVVVEPEQRQTYATYYDPSYSGELRIPIEDIKPLPFGPRKVIVRRAAMELFPGAICNLGAGVCTGISTIAAEESNLLIDNSPLKIAQSSCGTFTNPISEVSPRRNHFSVNGERDRNRSTGFFSVSSI